MNLENTCYIVGAASLDGVRLSPRPGDYVIAADGGYRSLKDRGIEPDFVMGDFDSLGYRPDHPNVETHPVMKDDTDLGLAVRWALAHGYRRLVMAGALGGRIDPDDREPADAARAHGRGRAGLAHRLRLGGHGGAKRHADLSRRHGGHGVGVQQRRHRARRHAARPALRDHGRGAALRHAARREQFLHRRGGHGARHGRHGLCPLAGRRAARTGLEVRHGAD